MSESGVKLSPDFNKLWFGQTVSRLGSQVTLFALPTFAVLRLNATPFQLGTLTALEFLPFPVIGLIAGVWVDRLPRRAVMIVADLFRCALLASIPFAATLHWITLNQLYAVAVLTGTCTVFFDVGYASYLPLIVKREALIAANARMQFSESASQIAGNALGGVLVQWVGAARAIGVDAASFVVSILSLVQIRVPGVPPRRETGAHPPDFFLELLEGLQSVWNNRQLRFIAANIAVANLGASIVNAVLFIFYYHDLHLSPGSLGLVLGFSNIGFLGALCATFVSERFEMKTTLILTAALASIAAACIPLARHGFPLVVIFFTNALESAVLPLYNITQGTYRQRITPDHLLGRVSATMRTFVWGTLPLGSLIGGVLGNAVGVVPTILTGALISACGVAFLFGLRVSEAEKGKGSPTAREPL